MRPRFTNFLLSPLLICPPLFPGGELFDHILAHKYLKERDAVRLFAQLISGVSYLHQKKIVHRDLKLENLLLDRNRNVIITDFGFANNFESRRDDLMATSCGSPCYAAPELVVQDGLYAGSAVDVWSCGVILYAMLAGYLPFDDDPQNPDGDNINLLYKYIMATPLSFPDYITAQPRDLLSKMLVPDPLRRADLKGVMGHSWLAAYRDLFNFSVQELESAAFEQQTKKRQAYRQQMMVQHQMQEQQKHQQQQQQQLARSQTTRGAGITTGGVNPVDALSPNNSQSTKSQRHHSAMATPSAMPERMYESSSAIASSAGSGASSGAAVSRSRPVTGMPTPTSSAAKAGDQPLGSLNSPHSHFDAITAQGEARGEPRTRVEDGYVSSSRNANPPTASERKVREAEAAAAKIPSAQKVQRHTIQLEYEEPERSTRREPRNNGTSEATAPPPVPKVARQDSTSAANATPVVVPSHEKAIEQKTSKTSDVLTGIPSPIMETKSPSASPTVVPSASIPQQESSETDSARASLGAGRPSSSTSRGASNPLPQVGSENVPFPDPNANGTTNGRVVSVGGGPTRKSTTTSKSQLEAINSNGKSSTPEKSSRHRKGMSTDKFFFSRLLGSSPNVANSAASEPLGPRASLAAARSPDAQSHPGGDMQRQASNNSGKGSAGSRRKAVSLVMGRPGESSPAVREKDKANAAAKAAKEERRLTGRARKDTANSQNQMPPPSTPKTSNGPTGSVLSTSGQSTASTNAGSRRQPSDASSRPAPTSGASVASGSVRAPSSHALFDNEGANDSTSTVGPSSSAAKKVMDWFRKKSLSKGSGFAEQPPLGPFVHHSPSANPSVIVTNTANGSPHANGNGVAANGTEPDSGPSSRSTSGTHSQISNATDTTGMTSEASGTISSNRSGAPVKSSILGEQQPTPRASTALMSNAASEAPPSSVGAFSNSTSRSGASSFNDTSLRFHLGAVDQTALTSRPPPLVLASVKSALYEMGIEVRKEKDEDFKLDCVRKKRAKTLMGATAGLGLSIRTSVFPPTQNDYEKSSMTRSPTSPNNAGDQPMSPSASSGPGGSIRNFLRRGSQQTGVNHAGSPPSATSALPDEWDRNGNQPTPLYGEASVDGGQEVRFSVEVTKIKNLPGLYSLDIRRMKGNLWAYKFLYHALLERSQLASTATA